MSSEAADTNNPTDYDRWHDVSNTWGERNPLRARTIARLIPKGASVLDIGAGSMILQRHLPPDCRYTPCDIYARTPGCLVADLNAGEFPGGRYEWVVMAGLLQYLQDPQWAVRNGLSVASRGIFTYTPTTPRPSRGEIEWREGWGWVNHLSMAEFIRLLRGAGWRIDKRLYIHLNCIMVCHANEKH